MTHSELLDRVPPLEFPRWLAFYRLEGREREERMAHAKNNGGRG